MTSKIDTIVCIYLSTKDSVLLEAFYQSEFGQIFLSDHKYKIFEVYSDPNISDSYESQDKLFLNTPESYSKLSLKTFEMIRFLYKNYKFLRIIKIDVACVRYLQESFTKKSEKTNKDLINALVARENPYDDYDGIHFHQSPLRSDIENWALKKNGHIELDKVFGKSGQMPSWFIGACYSVSYRFAKYIAENGQEMANQHAEFLWGSEDMMIGRLYEQFKKYLPPPSPLNAFLEHIINLGGIKRVLWIGLPDKPFPNAASFVDHIYFYDPNLLMNYESFCKQISDLYNKDIDDTLIKVNFQKSFSIPTDLLKDSLIVCLDLFDLLIEPRHLIKSLAKIRLNSNYMVITTKDRLITNGYSIHSTNKLHSICPRWSAESFFQLLIDNGFPSNMFFGHVTSSSSLAPKDTIIALVGLEIEPKIFSKSFRIAAIINIFNEVDIIEVVVRHLVSQGIDVHIFDNWSDDGSYELCQKLFKQKKVKMISRFPEKKSHEYQWAEQLENTVKYAQKLNVDWVIHNDADEIRCSPWSDLTLSEAIQFIDSLGYNAIDFTVIDFRFTDESDKIFSQNRLKYFEFAAHFPNFQQVKAWKNNNQLVDLRYSGGHEVFFDGKRIYPIKFLIKHYSLRSKEQAYKKIFKNRLPRIQRERAELGWHGHLNYYEEVGSLSPWIKEKLHYYHQISFDDQFLIERISGCGLLKTDYQPASDEFYNRLMSKKSSLELEKSSLELENSELKDLLMKRNNAIAELGAVLNSVYQSRSWRFMSGFRSLTSYLRKLTSYQK